MESKQLQSDLGYVRHAVEEAGHNRPSPAAIPLLWAAIVLVGFPLVDFAPRYVGTYWMVAGPAGFVISLFLGWQASRRSGQITKGEGLRYSLHWGAMLAAIALAVLLVPANVVSDKSIGQIILLLLALTYFLAGVHLERRLLWLGLLLAAGYIVLLFVSTYAWTILGVASAVALTISALVGDSKRVQAEG